MTRLVLVRHGESVVTVNRVIGGLRSCTGLSPLGRRQAEALCDRWMAYPEFAADVLISSTMPRAMETAELVAPSLGCLAVELDPLLCEQDPGLADGLTFEAYVERYGQPRAGLDQEIFPDGETARQFHVRVTQGLTGILERHDGATVVIVCHGGVIDVGLRHLLGLPTMGHFELHTVNSSITELSDHGIWVLHRYNDAAHLGRIS